MHGRYRNGPGNGFRSNAMGMGSVGAASRILPEGSFRGHRMHGHDNRNYNRGGYARGGHSKHFQPPPRETNVFVEAGRLAAEYLVSKGVLPPNALSGKFPLDDLKNMLSNFPGFKPREAATSQILGDGPGSSRARMGNISRIDAGREMRNNSEEYDSTGQGNSVRGVKRLGSFESNVSEVLKLERSVSSAEKPLISPMVEADDNASVEKHDELPTDKHHNAGEITQKLDEIHKVSGLVDSDVVEAQEATSSSLTNEVNTEKETIIMSVDADDKLGDEGMCKEDNDSKPKDAETKDDLSSTRDGNLVGEDYVDLVKQCKFVNVPTKIRSSLKLKGAKNHLDSTSCADQKVEVSEGPVVDVIDVDAGSSSGNVSPDQNHEIKVVYQPDALKDPMLEEGKGVTLVTRQGQHLRSNSFPEGSLLKDKKPVEQLSGFASPDAGFSERAGKRAFDDENDQRGEVFKKLKEWNPAVNGQSDDHPQSSSSIDNQSTLDEPKTSLIAHATSTPDHRFLDVSIHPRAHVDSCEFMEEKLLFPGSFKTCDLNLVGTSNFNGNHGADAKIFLPSPTETRKEPTPPINIGFSMSNNGNLPNKISVTRNNIEIIDLENDSGEDDRTFGNLEKRGDTVFTDLDGFPNNVHNPNDVQDGYGLMISEFLANGSSSCSSVPPDLNSLHGHMGLPNPEGILGDDESIYMSLGEIPLSLLGPWEQPSQDYGKPF